MFPFVHPQSQFLPPSLPFVTQFPSCCWFPGWIVSSPFVVRLVGSSPPQPRACTLPRLPRLYLPFPPHTYGTARSPTHARTHTRLRCPGSFPVTYPSSTYLPRFPRTPTPPQFVRSFRAFGSMVRSPFPVRVARILVPQLSSMPFSSWFGPQFVPRVPRPFPHLYPTLPQFRVRSPVPLAAACVTLQPLPPHLRFTPDPSYPSSLSSMSSFWTT